MNRGMYNASSKKLEQKKNVKIIVMTKDKLGTLKKVDLREVWESENSDFTPWLAQEENIEILGEKIGLDLEVEAQEKNVGKFRADILCKDINTDNWVLIE